MVIAALFPRARWYPFGYRVHHFHTGLAFLTAGIVARSRRLLVVGALLCADDVADWRYGCRLPVHRRYGG